MKIKFVCLFFVWITTFDFFGQQDEPRLNEIRILASHNSYKKIPHPKVIRFLSLFKKQLGPENDPIQLDYGHLTLEEQLSNYHIRGFELDVYYDPNGGLYRKRKLNRFLIGQKVKIREKRMNDPGFKVLHIPDIDFETNYLTLKDALFSLNNWSLRNPNHTPIFVNIEAKGSSAADESGFLRFIGFKRAIKMNEEAFQKLDEEILSMIEKESILTPKDLKSTYGTISERLTIDGWPLLKDCLGKIIFILQGNNDELYKQSINSGADRLMFVYGEPTESSTAFVVRNESIGREEEINELSKKYIVRSRTDAGTLQCRDNNYSNFKSVIKSNAQIISTDYYKPDLRWSSFQIILEGLNSEIPYILKAN